MIDNPIKVRLSIIYNTWERRGGYNSRTRSASSYETRRQRVKTLIAFFTDVERSKDSFFSSLLSFFFLFLSSFFPFSSRGGCVAERKQEDNAVTGSSSPSTISRGFKEILDYFSDIGSTQFPISSIHSHVPVARSNPRRDGTSVHSQF